MDSGVVRGVVALDGPAGAGKSTVALALAQRLGLAYVETGAIYRAVAFEAQRRGVSWEDAAELARIASLLEIRFEMQGDVNHVFLGQEDVTQALRANAISGGASKVSGHAAVREALLDLQRKLGSQGRGAVLEGRDIGTVVFPDARHKFFITASVEIRAQRRYRQLEAAGKPVAIEQLMTEIRARDLADSTRAVAPLKPAEDATILDTSDIPLDDVVDQVIRMVEAARD